jgi:endonuclease/exonuclease/phosphatase family metal-dependent hydrolase
MKILVLLLLQSLSILASAQSYRIMTYNIRFDNPADGPNAWENRKAKVIALLQKHNPDIIGIQEALHHQLEDIIASLPEYTYVGVGRDDGKIKGEYSALIIRKHKFEVLDQNTFWLSETPNIPGSKSWDAMITRVVTWATIKDLETKRMFTVMNTHFDHIGTEARKQSALILKKYTEDQAPRMPIIVTGDFNTTREEDPYQIMIKKEGRLLIDPAPQNPPGTFCNFEVNSMVCRPIDYIFHTPEWKSEKYMVITDNDGQYYPSDHLPVVVTLTLSKSSRRSKR